MSLFLIILLVLLLAGGVPYATMNWGYGSGGLIGVVVIILLILLLTGRL
jgi:hypothetical protein